VRVSVEGALSSTVGNTTVTGNTAVLGHTVRFVDAKGAVVGMLERVQLWSLTVTSDAMGFSFSTCQSPATATFDTVVYVFQAQSNGGGPAVLGELVSSNDDDDSCLANQRLSSTTPSRLRSGHYVIVVGGYNATAVGPYSLSVQAVAVNSGAAETQAPTAVTQLAASGSTSDNSKDGTAVTALAVLFACLLIAGVVGVVIVARRGGRDVASTHAKALTGTTVHTFNSGVQTGLDDPSNDADYPHGAALEWGADVADCTHGAELQWDADDIRPTPSPATLTNTTPTRRRISPGGASANGAVHGTAPAHTGNGISVTPAIDSIDSELDASSSGSPLAAAAGVATSPTAPTSPALDLTATTSPPAHRGIVTVVSVSSDDGSIADNTLPYSEKSHVAPIEPGDPVGRAIESGLGSDSAHDYSYSDDSVTDMQPEDSPRTHLQSTPLRTGCTEATTVDVDTDVVSVSP
jgi:hypothetical protein